MFSRERIHDDGFLAPVFQSVRHSIHALDYLPTAGYVGWGTLELDVLGLKL